VDDPFVISIIVAVGASFLSFVYVVIRLAIGDGLRDFDKWKNRK